VHLRADRPSKAAETAARRARDMILGTAMAHTTIEVGENVTESVITSRSADELNLK
jgi:molybdopterin-binding protein